MNEKKVCIYCDEVVDARFKFCPICGEGEFKRNIERNSTLYDPTENMDDYYDNDFEERNSINRNEGYSNSINRNGGYSNSIDRNEGYGNRELEYREREYNRNTNCNNRVNDRQTNQRNEKGKTGLSNMQIGIIISAAVLVLGIGIALAIKIPNTSAKDGSNVAKVGSMFKGEDKSKDDAGSEDKVKTGDNDDGVDVVGYTKGELTGDTYVNEWVGVKIKAPAGYKNAGDSYYSIYDSADVECGLYFMNSQGNSIINIHSDFEDSGEVLTSKQFNDAMGESIVNSFSSHNYEKLEDGTVEIAGKEYDAIHLKASIGGKNVVQSIYSRSIDNKITTFIISTVYGSVGGNNTIVSGFEKYTTL